MPILDFREIPEANVSGGDQDRFELFARDFLEYMGYKAVSGPDRGADGGRDILLEEVRPGVGGITKLKWLVSCKHFAHSGRSVGVDDENSIVDRVKSKSCDGFICFLSTLPSSGLVNRLEGLGKEVSHNIFDHEKIENSLLRSGDGIKLAERYFPLSMATFKRENPEKVDILIKTDPLKCHYCARNLVLNDSKEGIFVEWKERGRTEGDPAEKLVQFYWCCKGKCDDELIKKNKRRRNLFSS